MSTVHPEVALYPIRETCFETVHPGQLNKWGKTFYQHYKMECPLDQSNTQQENLEYAVTFQSRVSYHKIIFMSKFVSVWLQSMYFKPLGQ